VGTNGPKLNIFFDVTVKSYLFYLSTLDLSTENVTEIEMYENGIYAKKKRLNEKNKACVLKY